MRPVAGSRASVRPYEVVTTTRPPTAIGDESTVPGRLTCRRTRRFTFAAVIPVAGPTPCRAPSKPKRGQLPAGCAAPDAPTAASAISATAPRLLREAVDTHRRPSHVQAL